MSILLSALLGRPAEPDVAVRRVLAAQDPQPAPQAGDLYLMDAAWPPARQAAFAQACAAAGAAALASERPWAEALDLAGRLANHYRLRYRQVTDVAMRFLDITLKAPDLGSMVRYFGEIMHNPVIVYDEFFHPVISADPRLEGYDRDPATLEKRDLMNLFYYKQQVSFWDGAAPSPSCVRLLFPVLYHGMAKGYLAIFDVETPWEDMDPTLLALFGNAALTEMRRMLDLKHVEERYISDFLYDLVFRRDARQAELRRRAKTLDLGEDAQYCIIALSPKGEVADPRPDINGYMPKEPYWDDRVMNHAGSFIRSRWKRDVVTRFEHVTLILHRLHQAEREGLRDLKQLGAWLRERMAGPFAGMVFQVGVGSVADGLDGVADSYHRAMDALSYGTLYHGSEGGFVISWQDSGLLKLFGKLKEADAVYDVIPPALMALEEYDRTHRGGLIATLSTYLNCNCNAKRASELLFIHYKTMRYRLKKIQEEFGLDLERGVSRVQIELGLQLMDIITAQRDAGQN